MAKRQASTHTSSPPDDYTPEQLRKMVGKGEPLPSGYAYNPRRRPPIYKLDGDQGAVPGPDQAPPSGPSEREQKATE